MTGRGAVELPSAEQVLAEAQVLGAQAGAAEAKTATYVVQKREVQGNPHGAFWVDIAQVTVPIRSQRKTILREAVAQGLELPATVRILDADAAEEVPVSLGEAQRPLVIG